MQYDTLNSNLLNTPQLGGSNLRIWRRLAVIVAAVFVTRLTHSVWVDVGNNVAEMKTIRCLTNLHCLSRAALEYAQDYIQTNVTIAACTKEGDRNRC